MKLLHNRQLRGKKEESEKNIITQTQKKKENDLIMKCTNEIASPICLFLYITFT
jgi:hypothetical protein